mgnify:CR=1 FL=1
MNTNDYITHIKYAVAFAESQKSRISDANTKGVKVLPLHVEDSKTPCSISRDFGIIQKLE